MKSFNQIEANLESNSLSTMGMKKKTKKKKKKKMFASESND
jgi:hypothetical protein